MPAAARLLLVEDEANMVRTLAKILVRKGYEVEAACTGQEALGRLSAATYDLVITDLNMPVMDGMTLIRQLRAKPEFKFTPILMLTTESQEAKKQEGRAAGATGWIVKPFNPQQLLAVVAKVVR
jgi:two-component system chemotaxis response regulator CheY